MVLELAVKAFATKRITRLVVDDHIFDDLRERWFEKHPPDTDNLGYIITCPACTSVWAGALVASGLLPRFLWYTLALSEVSILLSRLDTD
jgi:hypothetical protein